MRREKNSVSGTLRAGRHGAVKEQAGVLHEERPSFREEHFEPLVGRDLRLVGLHLTEVGIHGQVERQRVADDDFSVEAGAAIEIALRPAARRRQV